MNTNQEFQPCLIKGRFISLTGSGHQDCFTMMVTLTLQHVAINKENGHKQEDLVTLRSSSVRKRFSELCDDRGGVVLGSALSNQTN